VKLVVATRNAGKLKEIRRLLESSGIEVLGMESFAGLPEVVEDGDTFRANAEKKARAVAQWTGCLSLADDSGLEVAALGGLPGVHSAYYAGPEANDTANNAKLLQALAEVAAPRRAAFVCTMALCEPTGPCQFFLGRLEGEILAEPRGAGGFGYDPLFLVPDFGKTLAELPLAEKNGISHRGRALRQVVDFLSQNS
jgi:XTP/dITP diphosphohydrolase